MARKRKPVRKRAHRGPQKERVVITDPETRQELLLKDRAIRAEFDAADKEGKAALERHDYRALRDAMDREGRAILEHARLVKKRRT